MTKKSQQTSHSAGKFSVTALVDQVLHNRSLIGVVGIVFIFFLVVKLALSFHRTPHTEQTSQIPIVSIQHLVAKTHTADILLTGFTKASQDVVINTSVNGTILSLDVDKGTPVKKGQELLRMRDDDRTAKHVAAKSRLEQKELEFEATKKLTGKAFKSSNDLKLAQADLDKARADLKTIEVEMGYSFVKAPFDGVCEERFVEVGSTCSNFAQTPLVRVIALDPLKILVYASEATINEIKNGQKAMVEFPTLPGVKKEAVVTFVSGSADPVTRTYLLEVTMENADYAIRDGVTAKTTLIGGESYVHAIPSSTISLKDEGIVGVKIIQNGKSTGESGSKEGKIGFLPIQITDYDKDYVMVPGLPKDIDLVRFGGEFVNEGQVVVGHLWQQDNQAKITEQERH